MIDEIVHIETFKNQTQKQKKQLKDPHEYEVGRILILEDTSEKEMSGPRKQWMFKRSRHEIWSVFIFCFLI